MELLVSQANLHEYWAAQFLAVSPQNQESACPAWHMYSRGKRLNGWATNWRGIEVGYIRLKEKALNVLQQDDGHIWLQNEDFSFSNIIAVPLDLLLKIFYRCSFAQQDTQWAFDVCPVAQI